QLDPESTAYNIPAAVRLEGDLDVVALERAVSEVVRRHEALRTRFPMVDGEPVQEIEPAREVSLPVIDLGSLDGAERVEATRRQVREEARRPFDLSRGPLLRCGLLRLGPEDHVALLTMHHIISDGWSMGVLINEVSRLYEAYAKQEPSPLEELAIQYADYARWQRGWLSEEVLERQLEYWKKQLEGAPPMLELPTDRPRPAVQSSRGARRTVLVPAEVTRGLKELSQGEGVTLFMVLLAAFQALLHRYS